MKKLIAATLAASFVTIPAFAQNDSQMCQEAKTLLETSGISVEMPEGTTDMQSCTIVGILSDDGLNNSQKEFQVKKVLGME
jgi:hypothetical protein